MLLLPLDVLKKAYQVCQGLPNNSTGPWTEQNTYDFKSHYGSWPEVVANIWHDMMNTDIDLGLNESDKSDKGFRMFMIAQHFLWTYPKNSKLLASRFGICEQNARGGLLCHWVRMMVKLKAKKIV
jgi:hypothetical protein